MKKILGVLALVLSSIAFIGIMVASCGANKKIIHKGADGGGGGPCGYLPGDCRP